MSRETTNLAKLGELQTFGNALANNSASIPHLEVSRTQYATMVNKAMDLVSRQGALAAEKQEISKQLRETMDEASRLGTVLRFAVKQHFGIRAEKLTEFSLQPFRGRKRSAPAPVPPTDPAKQ